MKIFKYLLMAVILVTMFPFNLFSKEPTYQELWKKVEKAQEDSLPQTALKELAPVLEKALKENEPAWVIKAICTKVVLEGEIEGNLPEEKIIRFEKAIENYDEQFKPMLKVILANWYYHYYSRNRYRFIRRSKTEQLDSNDFKTWDLPKLFSHISNLYDSALEKQEELAKIPISKFDDFLEKGNQPAELRSNLYEFLLHDALKFYKNDDQSTAKPQNAFEIDADSKVFSDVKDFITWKPETQDTTSANYKALKLYQNLLSLNIAASNNNALVVNDIDRIKWANNVSVGPNKLENYKKALLNVINNNKDSSYSATAMYLLAVEYLNKQENLKALEFAEKAFSKWPESYGGTMAQNIISAIKCPSISYEAEKVINPAYNKIKINFKNINHAYFRLVKRNDEDILNPAGADSYSDHSGIDSERIINSTPAYTFDTALDPGSEYKNITKEISLPKIDKGYYWIICSTKPDFTLEKNAINIGAMIVSDLAVIKREESTNGKIELFVVDAVSGAPITGATCKIYKKQYSSHQLYATEKTDKNGRAAIKVSNGNGLIVCSYKNDKVYNEYSYYLSNERKDYTETNVYFFTDRGIYRPGQTIYFKAIAVSTNEGENEYEVLKDTKLEVNFYDTNYQLVKSLDLKTNEFGSCSGTFVAPTDRLTGSYSINCDSMDINGSTRVRIEEYKRPKFAVTIDTPKEEFQLGQTVKLKGHAKAYTGAAVDNGNVKFRVIRRANFPIWHFWRSSSPAQEIKHGSIKTDSNGEFEISFEALPDKSLAKEDDPRFTYEVSADVTDNSGETRSGATSVTLAYTAMALNIASNESYNCKNPLELAINSATHNGNGIAATGRLQIIELKQPDKPIRHSYRGTDVINNESAIRLMPEGKVVVEEGFETDSKGSYKKSFNLTEGIYKIKTTSNDKYGAEVKAERIIKAINFESDKMTVKLPFFFVSVNDNLKPGDTYKGFWATGYEQGPAYVEIIHRRKVLKSFWTDSKKNKQFITFPITEDLRGGFIIKVFQVKENKLYENKTTVSVPWTNKELKVKLVHFTSKMEPGSKESWNLEISGEDAEMKTIEMLASMYDASLDAYASSYWHNIGNFYHDSDYTGNSFTNFGANLTPYKRNFGRTYKKYEVKYTSFPREIIEDYMNAYGMFAMSDSAVFLTRSVSKSVAAPMAGMKNSVRASVQSLDTVAEESAIAAADYEESNGKAYKESGTANSSIQEEIDLSNVKARSNLNETAFFLPHLTVDKDGIVTVNFEMPEALTSWKFRAYAHGTKLQEGQCSQQVVTQKELMVQPNAPRFLRENDKLEFSVKVTNLSDKEQTGQVALNFLDAVSDENRDNEFKNNNSKKNFKLAAGQSEGITWLIEVPQKPGFVKYKTVGATAANSDGEEGLIPILSSRILVTESLPLPIRDKGTKEYKFEKLINSKESNTLEHRDLTVEVTSNPAWYAVQALPYLIDFPHECTDQTFNRLYANKLAQHIANSDPRIRNVFNLWLKDEQYNKGTALMSNLEKNQHLKSLTLMETPWVLDAKSENESKHNIGVLFEESRLESELEKATKKLKVVQNTDGAFPWFPGGFKSTFITNYIMNGFGRLRQVGCDIDLTIALKCVEYLDSQAIKWYREIIKDDNYKNSSQINSSIAFYLYGRSFFLKDKKIPSSSKVAVDFFIDQAKKYWQGLPRMSQAHIALALQRFNDKVTPAKIVKSIKEHSVTNEEMGRFWRENEISYSWNRAEIETQAMMIELFSEIAKDEKAVEECKIWLLKQKQTQAWKTTKATADAVYALILKGTNLLASDKLVKVKLAGIEVKPEKVETGTGYYQKIFSGSEVKPEMGNIQISKEDKGVAWGAVHWQYLEDMSKVTPFENNLKLKKTLFIKENTTKGPTIKPVTDGKLKVGDLLVVRIELRTDRDLEFVHLKDQRGSGIEPVNVISKYKWQDGLGYYESTKDAASHFYIDYLPKGTYVFEYEARVQLAGEYQTGIAEIQCMYAPEFNSHSESFMLNVKQQ